MAPLLKSLLGNGSKNREVTDEMRAVLHEMRQERGNYETLVKSARTSVDRLQQLGEPIAKAGTDLDALHARLAALEQLAGRLQTLDERAAALERGQEDSEARIDRATGEAERTNALLEELGRKVDAALALEDRLATFLEMDTPLATLRRDADALRGDMDGMGEQLGRLREQHDRAMDAHKVALTKLETFDQRHDQLARAVQDKEQRVTGVEQVLRGVEEVREKVDDAMRRLGTLKALGDYVAQKTTALQAQREAIEQALTRAEHLDQAMRRIDVGVQQQQENAKALGALREQATALQSLHNSVIQRSSEIAQLQRESDERTRATRQELVAVRDELKKNLDRFEFESRGMESVSQRVADLRSGLADFELRFNTLSEASQGLGELQVQARTLGGQLQGFASEIGRLDQETQHVQGLRRELDAVEKTTRDLGERVERMEEARPGVEAALKDVEQLSSVHAMVKDALEQARMAQAEIARARENQGDTRSWLNGVEQSLAEVRHQVEDLRQVAPTVETARREVERVSEGMAAIEARRGAVEELQRRVGELATTAGQLDERGLDLADRIEASEERLSGLAAHTEEAQRLEGSVRALSEKVQEVQRDVGGIGKTVATLESRCTSVEELAERTRALREEVDQRQHALEDAARDLERASTLRQEAAASAQELDQRTKELAAALEAAEAEGEELATVVARLEDRAHTLRSVDQQLVHFEGQLAKWKVMEQEATRSLEQLSARQGTLEALQADVERMFAMAEQTTANVRTITAARSEIHESRTLLDDVMQRLKAVHETATALDERKRQMSQAENRLARAEALLIDVRTSLETLQGQKVVVDQAVEKAGSLRILVKQAEAMIEGLREERDIATRVQAAVAAVRQEDGANDLEVGEPNGAGG